MRCDAEEKDCAWMRNGLQESGMESLRLVSNMRRVSRWAWTLLDSLGAAGSSGFSCGHGSDVRRGFAYRKR
jgi:hypothetical protein